MNDVRLKGRIAGHSIKKRTNKIVREDREDTKVKSQNKMQRVQRRNTSATLRRRPPF